MKLTTAMMRKLDNAEANMNKYSNNEFLELTCMAHLKNRVEYKMFLKVEGKLRVLLLYHKYIPNNSLTLFLTSGISFTSDSYRLKLDDILL